MTNLLRARLCSSLAVACAASFLFLSGCQTGDSSSGFEEIRNKILADQHSGDVLSLAQANAGDPDGTQVQVVGRIFAADMSPFDAKTAAFNLIELPKPGHDHENPGDCPFCKREMENAATAIVQIVDDKGEVLGTSAETMLDLKRNQDIVVQGATSKVGEFLVLTASSIHVLSKDEGAEFAKQIHAEPEEASEEGSSEEAPLEEPPAEQASEVPTDDPSAAGNEYSGSEEGHESQ